MRLQDLQDKLRAHIRARIDRREMTGSGLSREAGFQQGHLSNFLNARRGLSLESMDRLLETLNIGVLDLADLKEIEQQVSFPAGGLENVALVSGEQAARLPRFSPEQVRESRSFSKSLLRRLKPNDASNRSDWVRFVLLRLDAREAAGMFPHLLAGVTLLVDRHYNSLQPYRRFRPNIYAVHAEARCLIGYVSVSGDHLVLRPRNPQHSVELVRIDRGRSYHDYIVGRVCHVGFEV
jgi:transcriptional regulator with XRE-family HTH domain